MKQLSDFEKKIIKEVIKIDNTIGGLNVLGNIIDDELFPNLYFELRSENNCPLMIEQTYLESLTNNFGSSGLSEFLKRQQEKFLLLVRLFQYLESENYIIFSGKIDLNQLGSITVGAKYVAYRIPDPEIVKLIFKFSKLVIIPTDSLKQFVKNGFKTDTEKKTLEELEINKQMLKWTARGVIFTGLGILLSSIIQLIDLFGSTDNNVKIDTPINIMLKVDSTSISGLSKDTLDINILKHLNIDTFYIHSPKVKYKLTKGIITKRDTCICVSK
jgi:hypothetical protein